VQGDNGHPPHQPRRNRLHHQPTLQALQVTD
jgi:hypothetical protein